MSYCEKHRPKSWVQVDLSPVDDLVERVRTLDSPSMGYLYFRLYEVRGFMRDLFGAWGYLNDRRLKRKLPAALRLRVDRFWKAVEDVCRRREREPRLICCKQYRANMLRRVRRAFRTTPPPGSRRRCRI